jgi:hypothetical protein
MRNSRCYRRGLVVLGVVLSLLGCAPAPPLVDTPGEAEVRTGKADPDAGAQELGPITATHGGGCGMFGHKGSYEGATALLKQKAASLGADYVQVYQIVEPHWEVGCGMFQGFTIRGTAYRQRR